MILTTSSGTNSGFSFNKKVIENRGFKESDNYWTELRLIKNTGLRANNFEWKVDLKNAAKDGAIVCNDIVAEVLLENSTIKIHFVQPGCTLFSEIILPHKKLKGNTADLSFLGIDFEDFKKLKIRANNNKITFWIDDRLIYEDIIQNNTVIKGFVLKFKGCGAAKNISISSIQ